MTGLVVAGVVAVAGVVTVAVDGIVIVMVAVALMSTP